MKKHSGPSLIRNTIDAIAIQNFFLTVPGTANVGQYQFPPASRSYTPLIGFQTAQNPDTLTFGDVIGTFAHRTGGPSQDAASDDTMSYDVPATVAAVTLPEAVVDQAKSSLIATVKMARVSKSAQSTPLLRAAPPNHFIFIDANLQTQKPGHATPGRVATKGIR